VHNKRKRRCYAEKKSAQGSGAKIQQLERLIEEQAAAMAALRHEFELIAKGVLGPMLVRVNRTDRTIKPRLVASN
jgi:hypothetical protein